MGTSFFPPFFSSFIEWLENHFGLRQFTVGDVKFKKCNLGFEKKVRRGFLMRTRVGINRPHCAGTPFRNKAPWCPRPPGRKRARRRPPDSRKTPWWRGLAAPPFRSRAGLWGRLALPPPGHWPFFPGAERKPTENLEKGLPCKCRVAATIPGAYPHSPAHSRKGSWGASPGPKTARSNFKNGPHAAEHPKGLRGTGFPPPRTSC